MESAPDIDLSEVRCQTLAIQSAYRVQTQQLIRQARAVVVAKAKLPADAWAAWLAAAGMQAGTAALLERAHGLFSFDAIDEFHPAAVLLLSGPDVPPRAIAAARHLAQSGRAITYATARELIARYTPSPAAAAGDAAG